MHARATNGFEAEAQLARALARGGAPAYVTAWNQYAPLVRKVVKDVFGHTCEVEDVTQEVFLRLFSRVALLRRPESLRAFVISFAVRTAHAERRRRRVRSWLTLTESGALPEDPRSANLQETQWELGRLRRMLDELSTRERNVLLLRHLEGMKLTEIAAALRVSLATTKRVLKRASLRMAVLNREGGSISALRAVFRRKNRMAVVPPPPVVRARRTPAPRQGAVGNTARMAS